MILAAVNIPDLQDCDGIDLGVFCAPGLLTGLILGTAALVLIRLIKAIGQQGRILSNAHNDLPVFAGIPPRISLVRLAPPPDARRK